MYISLAKEIGFSRARSLAKESVGVRIAAFLDRAVFISLLALIALVAVPYGTVEAWWIAAFECAVFMLTALWIIEGWLCGSWHLKELRMFAPLLLLIIFAFVQTMPLLKTDGESGQSLWKAASADAYETKLFVLRLSALVLSGGLLLRYTSSARRLRALVSLIIVVGAASAAFGLARQALQQNAQGFFLPYLKLNAGYAQFINKNHFALLIEMSLGLALGLIACGGARRERLFIYGAGAFLMFAALVLTYSRGGIFSILSQLVFLALLSIFVRRARSLEEQDEDKLSKRKLIRQFALRAVLIASLLMVIASSVIWIGGDVLITRLESLPDEAGLAQGEAHAGVRRVEIWDASWKLFKDHPLIGSGFGAYTTAITKHHDASGAWTPEAAHNDYLELLTSGGLAGVLLFGWLVVALLKRALKLLRSSADRFQRAAICGALTGLFGVSLHSFVDFGLHVTINALFFVALAVIATANVRAGIEVLAMNNGFREN